MAIDLSQVTGTKRQSIARIEIFTDAALKPDDWQLVIHFEDTLVDADGNLLQSPQFGTRRVERRFGNIKDDQIALGAAALTVAQLAGMIQAAVYRYRKEDVDNPPPLLVGPTA